MKKIGFASNIKAVISDIDNTIYKREKDYFAEGTQREMDMVGEILGFCREEARRLIRERKKALAERSPTKTVTMTAVVYSLGITAKQWSDLRNIAWQPENWIEYDQEVVLAVCELKKRFVVAFGTNSPTLVGRRVVRILGIGKNLVPDEFIFGPERLGWISKPNPEFFRQIAVGITLRPENCISIGDREFSDGPPAMKAGYGGVIIVRGSRDEFLTAANNLITSQ